MLLGTLSFKVLVLRILTIRSSAIRKFNYFNHSGFCHAKTLLFGILIFQDFTFCKIYYSIFVLFGIHSIILLFRILTLRNYVIRNNLFFLNSKLRILILHYSTILLPFVNLPFNICTVRYCHSKILLFKILTLLDSVIRKSYYSGL